MKSELFLIPRRLQGRNGKEIKKNRFFENNFETFFGDRAYPETNQK
jgi:hypothetical protein